MIASIEPTMGQAMGPTMGPTVAAMGPTMEATMTAPVPMWPPVGPTAPAQVGPAAAATASKEETEISDEAELVTTAMGGADSKGAGPTGAGTKQQQWAVAAAKKAFSNRFIVIIIMKLHNY